MSLRWHSLQRGNGLASRRGCGWWLWVLDGFDGDGLDVFEVSAVVGQEGDVVIDSGASDHEVEVWDSDAS